MMNGPMSGRTYTGKQEDPDFLSRGRRATSIITAHYQRISPQRSQASQAGEGYVPHFTEAKYQYVVPSDPLPLPNTC